MLLSRFRLRSGEGRRRLPDPRTMVTLQERHRNNVRAGAFVSIAIMLSVVVLLILSDLPSRFTPLKRYTITYSVLAGVQNLSDGADVRIGGIRMGRVERVEPVIPQTSGGTLETIEVTVGLRSDVRLYDNAVAVVAAPIIGSGAWINITSVGDPSTGALLPPGGTLRGTDAAGLISALLGPGNQGKADEIVENARLFTEFLAGFPDEYETTYAPIANDLRAAMNDFRSLAVRVTEEDWPRWAATVNDVMTRVDRASESLNQLLDDAGGGVDRVNAMLDDNRADIDLIIDNVAATSGDSREIAARLADETIDKVHAVLDRGLEGIDAFAAVGEKLEPEVEGFMPYFREVLANSALASQQLKLTMIELRRSPWKLLYRPGTEELEHELLYEAARSFASAAADLKSASESVDRILTEHSDRLDTDPELRRELEERLINSFDRYKEAQQRLTDVLIDESP
jgi:ABC-type transporter Mla subunit MlaD